MREVLISLYGSDTQRSASAVALLDDDCTLANTSKHGYACSGSPGRIQLIQLSGRNLTGTISPSIGNLTTLYTFDISKNQVTGTVPPELGKLSQLQQLKLQENRLYGWLPIDLEELTDSLNDCSINIEDGFTNNFCCPVPGSDFDKSMNPLGNACILIACTEEPTCLSSREDADPSYAMCNNFRRDPGEEGIDCGRICQRICEQGETQASLAGESAFMKLLMEEVWFGPVVFGGGTLFVCGILLCVILCACMQTKKNRRGGRRSGSSKLSSTDATELRSRHRTSGSSTRRGTSSSGNGTSLSRGNSSVKAMRGATTTAAASEYSNSQILVNGGRSNRSVEPAYGGIGGDVLKAAKGGRASGYGVLPEGSEAGDSEYKSPITQGYVSGEGLLLPTSIGGEYTANNIFMADQSVSSGASEAGGEYGRMKGASGRSRSGTGGKPVKRKQVASTTNEYGNILDKATNLGADTGPISTGYTTSPEFLGEAMGFPTVPIDSEFVVSGTLEEAAMDSSSRTSRQSSSSKVGSRRVRRSRSGTASSLTKREKEKQEKKEAEEGKEEELDKIDEEEKEETPVADESAE